MSKIQDVPFITKVIDTLSDELKSGLYDLIDGQVKTPIFRSLVNNDYAITEANDKGKVQFVTLETLRGNYTGYLAYNSVYCVLIAFKGNTQALDMLNINVAKHTFAFVNESLSILELRVELEDGKKGVTPTDLGVTNNNIHLAKGTKQIGEGINLKTLDGNTLIGSGNVGFKTINDQEIVGDGNIVVGEGGTIAIDTAFDETSTNAVQNKVIAKFANEVVENKANVDGNYQTMTVGYADNANNLIATKGLTVNDDPMSFGIVGGAQKSAVGDGNATLNKLVCVDVVKNQYFNPSSSRTFSGLTATRNSNVVTLSGTYTGTKSYYEFFNIAPNRDGHKYLLFFKSISNPNNVAFTIGLLNGGVTILNTEGIAIKTSSAGSVTLSAIGLSNLVTNTNYDGISFEFYLIDLTQRYGSNEVVNAIIGSDTSTQVAKLLAFDPEILNNTDYDKGTLIPSKTAKLLSVGVNQWDEEWEGGGYWTDGTKNDSVKKGIRNKTPIRVIPNTTYYIYFGNTALAGLYIHFYDANMNKIGTTWNYTDKKNGTIVVPSNVYFMNIFAPAYGTTYNHDICINISDPTINGKYYTFKRDLVTLPNYEGYGILKVVDGKVVADGTELYPDGNSKKRYGVKILQNNDITEPQNVYENVKYFSITAPVDGEQILAKTAMLTKYGVAISAYPFDNSNLVGKLINNASSGSYWVGFPIGTTLEQAKQELTGQSLVYKLATEEDIETSTYQSTFPVEQGGKLQFLDENDNPIAGLQGNEIFYQKNIKAFVEAFGEAIDWNPERIERLAKLSITPEYVNISLNPSQTNAYAVAQVYNATFTIVISTALTGTPNGEITFQDSEIDLSSFETQPAESIYDMDGKKVSEEPTTEDCNIASFVGRSYNGIVLWSLLHSGVNKVKVHFEQTIPLDSEGNGKLDCRASLIL